MLPSILTLAGLGFLASLGLAVASRVFKVDIDPRVETIQELLPNANCGACGYPGCSGFAKAIVSGEGKIEGCVAVHEEDAIKIAEVMGVEIVDTEKSVAIVHCNHVEGGVGEKYRYLGVTDCRAADLIAGGPKLCTYSCIGLGTCADVCPFDAIIMDGGTPIIDPEKCVACGNCVEACPKDIMEIAPISKKIHVLCSSKEKGAATKKTCSVGCIACMACERVCPFDAITVTDNIARIDYDKCRVCGICVINCPTNSISDFRDYGLVAEIGDDCNGCTLCARACPVNAISGVPKERFEVDTKRCIGCGICANQCKNDAIEMVRLDKDTAKKVGASGV